MPAFGDPPTPPAEEKVELSVTDLLLWNILRQLEISNYASVRTVGIADLVRPFDIE